MYCIATAHLRCAAHSLFSITFQHLHTYNYVHLLAHLSFPCIQAFPHTSKTAKYFKERVSVNISRDYLESTLLLEFQIVAITVEKLRVQLAKTLH